MDASLYTLIGALGGVLVTQFANFLLEKKRGANQVLLKRLELKEQQRQELHRERRVAYAKYLEEFDRYVNDPIKGPESVLTSYYSALILASDETSTVLIASLNFILDGESEEIMQSKKQLFKAMQKDIKI